MFKLLTFLLLLAVSHGNLLQRLSDTKKSIEEMKENIGRREMQDELVVLESSTTPLPAQGTDPLLVLETTTTSRPTETTDGLLPLETTTRHPREGGVLGSGPILPPAPGTGTRRLMAEHFEAVPPLDLKLKLKLKAPVAEVYEMRRMMDEDGEPVMNELPPEEMED